VQLNETIVNNFQGLFTFKSYLFFDYSSILTRTNIIFLIKSLSKKRDTNVSY
jgi:hypothetical protein